MPQYIALLRGVNVGKAKRIAMADWKKSLLSLGMEKVATLLNSGNAIFRCKATKTATLSSRIRQALIDEHQLEVSVIVISAQELNTIVEGMPWTPSDPSRSFVIFTQETRLLMSLDASIRPLLGADEQLAVGPLAAYFDCPSGVLESQAGEKMLGKSGQGLTSRNWKTTLKLQQLVVSCS